jgi:hypothetical protein
MKEQFVNHEISALLKEKGFKEECMAFYEISIKAKEDPYDGFSGPFGWKKGEINFSKGYFENSGLPDNSNEYWLLCGAPLWQQVIDWFREKHSIEIWVGNWGIMIRSGLSHKEYEAYVKYRDANNTLYSEFFDDYKEARQAAIEQALTLI